MRRAAYRVPLLAGLALVLLPGALLAHGGLRSSTPVANARIERAPTELVLTFNDPSPLTVTRVRLVGADSQSVELGALSHVEGSSQRGVRVPIVGRLAAGTYAVEWQTASADGHPVRGRFTFVVVAGSAASAVSAADVGTLEPAVTPRGVKSPSVNSFDAASPLYALIRFVTFLALITLLGVVTFSTGVMAAIARNADLVVPIAVRVAAASRALRLAGMATLALGVAALARLAAQSYALFGAEAFDFRSVGAVLGGTLWGKGWILQMAGVGVAWGAVIALRRSRSYGWPLLTLATIALAMTPALSGHAASVTGKATLAVLADTLHVVGAGGWIGTLLLVVVAGIPAAWSLSEGDRELAVATLVRAFSPIALVFAGVLATTGLLSAWLHLDTVAALWQSTYGRTLALKLAVLSGVAATGWYNWKRVTPRLHTAAGVTLLRRTALAEVGIAVLVLAITAVLVATPPPSEMDPMGVGGRESPKTSALIAE